MERTSDNLIMKKKRLLEAVSNLSTTEYLEIFNIFIEDKCQYSENINGVFINLNNVNEETIDRINSFINFIKDKKQDLLSRDKEVQTMKDNYIKEEIIQENVSAIMQAENNNECEISDSEEEDKNKIDKYLDISSDEDENLENKLSLKKKRVKQTGKKAKIINSYKTTKSKNGNKEESE